MGWYHKSCLDHVHADTGDIPERYRSRAFGIVEFCTTAILLPGPWFVPWVT